MKLIQPSLGTGGGGPARQDVFKFPNAPTVNDDLAAGYLCGDTWIDTSTTGNDTYRLIDETNGAAIWRDVANLDELAVHTSDLSNPHQVTAAQAGASPVGHTHAHSEITGVGSDDHHVRYADSEAVAAMGVKADPNPLHHDRYLDSEAVGAMGPEGDGNPLNHTKYVHPNHTGDVTSIGDGAQTIALNAVLNTKLADMPTLTLKGNDTGATADPKDLTVAEVLAMLGIATLQISIINGQPVITFIDTTRGNKVLSASEMSVIYADNTLVDNDWVAVGRANDALTGYIFPMDATVIRVAVHCADDNGHAKEIDAYVNGVSVGTVVTLPGSNGETSVFAEDVDFDLFQGDKLQFRAGTTGNAIADTVIEVLYKWRKDP
jgi:hypothetical protein